MTFSRRQQQSCLKQPHPTFTPTFSHCQDAAGKLPWESSAWYQGAVKTCSAAPPQQGQSLRLLFASRARTEAPEMLCLLSDTSGTEPTSPRKRAPDDSGQLLTLTHPLTLANSFRLVCPGFLSHRATTHSASHPCSAWAAHYSPCQGARESETQHPSECLPDSQTGHEQSWLSF